MPQDVRGKFRSEGDTLAFVNEVPDSYDTIDWITRQSWSSGAVGMWGDSYYGFTQWAAVAARHPALKAIVPRVTIADIDTWLEGVTPLYGAHYLAEFWTDRNTNEWPVDWSRRPLSTLFDEGFAALGRRSASFDYLLDRSRGAARVGLFRRMRTPSTSCASPPSTAWAGSTTSALRTCSTTRRSSGHPETAPFQYLHAGSTDHENYPLRGRSPSPRRTITTVTTTHSSACCRATSAPALDFFDAFLSSSGDPAGIPRVRWHLPGVGWQESPSWPPSRRP